VFNIHYFRTIADSPENACDITQDFLDNIEDNRMKQIIGALSEDGIFHPLFDEIEYRRLDKKSYTIDSIKRELESLGQKPEETLEKLVAGLNLSAIEWWNIENYATYKRQIPGGSINVWKDHLNAFMLDKMGLTNIEQFGEEQTLSNKKEKYIVPAIIRI
jgi:hypothetical protein